MCSLLLLSQWMLSGLPVWTGTDVRGHAGRLGVPECGCPAGSGQSRGQGGTLAVPISQIQRAWNPARFPSRCLCRPLHRWPSLGLYHTGPGSSLHSRAASTTRGQIKSQRGCLIQGATLLSRDLPLQAFPGRAGVQPSPGQPWREAELAAR